MMGSYGSESLFNAPSGGSNKELALALMRADSEKEVINILKKTGYWDDDSAWRDYGDEDGNYSIIANQQSSADNALVEKLVNSVDAMLMRECLKRGIDPETIKAPQSISKAQREFFGIRDGRLSNISGKERVDLAKNILLVATGSKQKPSLAIIDKGEGQSPKRMPSTILSLIGNNKIKIPFVQGKFGMGGSGVLRFCSRDHSLMLVISKRNREIAKETDEEILGHGKDETRDLWGVTIVRREDPKTSEKNSRWTYLAPDGEISSFPAEKLPILENVSPNMTREPMESGTYIKLYEYDIGRGLSSVITFDLYYRLSLLMPNIAFPIRMIECRDYRGHSHETTLAGLSVRLDEAPSENLEPGYPGTGAISVEGQELSYSIYVFQKDKKVTYASKEGVAFSVNGQSHGFLLKNFFARKAVGVPYLSDSILVMVDCSKMDRRPQERLFMPSRDRLSEEAIRYAIENKLQDEIKNHPGLKDLQNRRRQEAIQSKLEDSKSFGEALENIINNNPSFARLFSLGDEIDAPPAVKLEAPLFEGEQFPTFFNLAKRYPENSPKICPINQEFKIKFSTDAENGYFDRVDAPGKLKLELNGKLIENYSLRLWNGEAALTIALPSGVNIGDILRFEVKVSDISQIQPLTSEFYVLVEVVAAKTISDPMATPKKPRLNLPKMIPIRREDWAERGFDKYSALQVKGTGEEGGYDFYINLDNFYLLDTIKKQSKIDPQILSNKYSYGLVLLGISILGFQNKKKKKKKNTDEPIGSQDDESAVENLIAEMSEAISPVLLPVVDFLSSPNIDFSGNLGTEFADE